jgi:16S rRNA (guanine966-N2)-methyltransferase
MSLRIGAGQYRSRRIECPEGIRPTTDMVKGAIFSALGMVMHGKDVLDLFSGSGALGIEALSRGADSVTFVDKSRQCINAITKNIAAFGALDKVSIFRTDAMSFVLACVNTFDLILMDPPYHNGLASRLAPHVYRLLRPGGVIVIEHSPKEEIDMESWKSRTYGDTIITFIMRSV